jgi:small subunit ribosomal protein S16
MLRIRLRRTGRRNRPTYRIVVAEHTAPLSGKVVEQLGHYDPRTKVTGVTLDRVTYWLSVGARPSNRVAKLLVSQGVTHPHVIVVVRAARPPKRSKDANGAHSEAAAAPVSVSSRSLPTSDGAPTTDETETDVPAPSKA